jgi:trimeric autotransporter adhesin
MDLNFIGSDGADLGIKLISKDYLISVYPSIANHLVTPELWVWGENNYGALASNDSINRLTPVTTFAGGSNWKQMAAGLQHVAAIKNDGTLWMWGNNSGSGNLGVNDNSIVASRSTPVTTFAGGSNWKKVACGYQHTAAIKTDGSLWVWGSNSSGQLGTNTSIVSRITPVTTFAGGNDWKQVSCGFSNTAAIKNDGTLWIWGAGSSGMGGTNSTASKLTPVTTFAGGNDWKQVTCGGSHTAAIKTDGTLWVWGLGVTGKLGTLDTQNKLTPVTTFAGGNDWRQVVCGGQYTAAIKTDGTLWCWGNNSSGQLGNNLILTVTTPVTTFAGGNNWRQIACSSTSTTSAIKTDGTLWVWGLNYRGNLGNNSTSSVLTPVTTFAGGNNWKMIAHGKNQTIAIKSIRGI